MVLSKAATSSPLNSHGEYFPHIDGIRAIAVIAVVLYHLNPSWCPSGFAGVDVFFVISGYLITGGIIRDISKGTFTIGDFYYRRIRRIIPAYLFLILSVLCAGLLIFYSHPLCALSDSAAASAVFLPNIYFWILGGDYFAPKTLPQPLLHLWSLGVEEQFYLIIPFICALIWTPSKKILFLVLLVLAATSLLTSIYFVSTDRSHDVFFLPHLRAWELLAGSILAVLPKAYRDSKFSFRSALAILGLFIILVGYYTSISKSHFPGATAVPFVIGTLLLIQHGNEKPISFILTSRFVRQIGKISYSLYLWHWPVIVFWKYCVFDQLLQADYIGIIAVTFTMSYLSWRFIETPARRSNGFTKHRAYFLTFGGCTAILAIGISCSHFRGWPRILHSDANRFAGNLDPISTIEGKLKGAISKVAQSKIGMHVECLQSVNRERKKELFEWGGPADGNLGKQGIAEIFLLGDSYAGSLQHGLDKTLGNANVSGIVKSQGATPMFDLRQPASKIALNRILSDSSIKIVVLSQNWSGYAKGHGGYFRNMDEMKTSLIAFASELKRNKKQLLILECVPTHKYPLNDIVARMKSYTPRTIKPEWKSLHQSSEWYQCTQGEINTKLQEAAIITESTCIPIQDSLFDGKGYQYFSTTTEGVLTPLYKDTGHLSQAGSELVATFLYRHYLSKVLAISKSEPH